MEKSWKENRNTFKTWAIVFLILIGLTFFQTHVYKKQNLAYKIIELTEDPKFGMDCAAKVGCTYYLELNPKTTDLRVSSIDYKFLKHKQFKENIGIGDKLKIGVLNETVLSLSKDGFEYLQFDKAQFYKKKNSLFLRYLFLAGMILSLTPLFFHKQPTIEIFDGYEQNIDFGWILGVGLFISAMVLLLTIGFNFGSSGEFIE